MSALVREMRPRDVEAVERIFTALVKDRGARDWPVRLSEMLQKKRAQVVALVGLDEREQVKGYLVGEVRAWEFGSRPAGWIFGLGVDPAAANRGLGKALRDEAVRRFHAQGVTSVRTMVKKDDVRVLRFFRDAGFVAGPYLEMELDLEESR